ncbi:PREDICTED: uncharacterized protein LOC106294506 [Brassica oleracea var. oleracea]|nr:PREDICTED: uncharacterized protein LOC106294506 [Brassica oleracea var. oleracea]
MDCNKEEATRAINLAEEKMRGGDFVGAHKLIMKAQRLFPELENVQKLLAVCDVHSSADKKIKGLDDWYGILQVLPSADSDTIKKQYRKLCLLLHPDKNKFPGAEAAFKLVGEANRWLSDQSKRSQYDVRYRSHSLFASKESNANANSLRNSSSANAAAVNIASGLTFWTCCRSCGHRYKYLKVYVNQLMHCSSCKKSYTACNIGSDGVSFSGSTAGVKQFQDQGISRQHPSTGAESGSSAAEMDKNGTVGGKLNKRYRKKQKRGSSNKKPKKDEGCTESEAEGGRPQKGETVANNSVEVAKPDVLKPQPEVKEPETSAAAEMNKNGTVGGKLNKRSHKKQKRGAGNKKPKKDEGCTESEAEGGRPQKGETVANNSVEVAKPDVLKPQPEVKEPETSAAAEMNKNGTVGGKLNKRSHKKQKRGAGNKKPKKDEGCTESEAEGGRPQKGETVANNSVEVAKPDVLKPQPEVKEPETSAAAEMNKNGTVGGKLNKRSHKKQKRGAGNKKPKKDEGCTESEAEGGRPQKGETVANNSVEVAKPDVLKPQPEVKEPETSAAAEMNKNGTVGGKLNKRSHKKQKRGAGNKKPKKDEGCTESEAEGGRPQKGETVANNSVEVAKPDVLKPQPEVKEPETSAAAEMNKNGTVGGKLNKRSHKKQKRGAGNKKPKKDEGCTESEAEGGRPQKGETVANNSVEVAKPDVLKPQPEVKEPETSAAAEMNKNGTVGGKLNKRSHKKQKRGAGNKKPKKDEGCTESEAEGGRPQKGETVANNSVEVAKPDVLKPQPEVKEPETSAAAEMNKNGTVGGKLNKRSHKKQKRGAGNKKPKKDEGCTESEAEGGRPQKGETVANNSVEVAKPDVLKPQPEVKEPETSAAAEMNKNGTVGGKLNKRSHKKQKRGAGNKKPKKDEGCTESEAEGGRPQKGETVANNSVEVAKPDVLKPQPEVKEPETSAAAEMDKNGTVGGKLNKREQEPQSQGAGDRMPEKDEGCTEKDLEGAGPQKGAEIPKPDILKPQPEEKEPQASAGKSVPVLSAQKTNQTARKKRKAVEESSMSFEVDGSDAAVNETHTDESNKRKFSRKKPQVSYAEKRGNGDSVIPPTKKMKSGCEVESDVNTKQTDENNTSPELADKGKAKESEDSGKKNILSAKNKEIESCDRNGEDEALSSKMGEVENGHRASENGNTLDIPDPEFNVFEDERKPENFAVNQVWSTCDSRDGMPRRYARVRKVLSSDFKLRVTYLKPVQENNDESIPVTWGKFNNGETKDVENRSIFSGQMLHSVCNRVVSIYPRKGEIWAMFSDWDEESSTLENHELPYKYDFVEIVNDFKEEAGIGAAYLGKVKGFVSLFQREAKNTVCQVQFAPERMLRFSHKVPAVKMTGIEKEGVPAGSYELDPTALPKDIFQAEAVNVEMDSETMKGKADSPDPEAPETEVNAKPVPEIVPSPPRKRQKSDDDGGCSNRDKVCSTSVSIGKGEATKANDSSSSQVSKKSTPNGCGEASDAFKLRKSPRLQTTPSQQIEEKKSAKQGDKINPPKTTDKVLVTDSLGINKSSKGIQQQVERQVGEGSKKRGRDGELPSSSKQNDLPAQLDGSTNRSLETTPASSSCKTPQRNAFDFDNERSVDKFRRDQIWAIYSDDKGMPTEYVKVKKVETKPEVVLHVAHMELCPPSTEPVTRPVSCGEFKMETGKPKTLPLTSFSHRVKPFDSKQKIVKVYPRKGDIWALRKSCDSTEAEHDIVEVVEGYCEGKSIKAMALTAKGFSSIYTRKHGSHVSSLVVPKAEMSRFSHQIPAVKQEKRATRVAEGGYWELDPAAIPPPTTIVID